MFSISDKETFAREMDDVAALYQEITGQEMVRFNSPLRKPLTDLVQQ